MGRDPRAAGGGARPRCGSLRCPLRGYIVAGIDARVTDRAIDVSIRGENGAPVGPGVTTGREVLFTAVYTGGARADGLPALHRLRPDLRRRRARRDRGPQADRVRPGKPLDRRVVERGSSPGAPCASSAGVPRGRGCSAPDASFGFRVQQEPGASLLNAVRVRRVVAGRTVTAVAHRRRLRPAAAPGAPPGPRALHAGTRELRGAVAPPRALLVPLARSGTGS